MIPEDKVEADGDVSKVGVSRKGKGCSITATLVTGCELLVHGTGKKCSVKHIKVNHQQYSDSCINFKQTTRESNYCAINSDINNNNCTQTIKIND